jgi:hypothetical protein
MAAQLAPIVISYARADGEALAPPGALLPAGRH